MIAHSVSFSPHQIKMGEIQTFGVIILFCYFQVLDEKGNLDELL